MSENTTISQKFLNAKELAKYISLSVSYIYKLTSRNEIPFIKVGGKVLFEIEAIESWLKSNSNNMGKAGE